MNPLLVRPAITFGVLALVLSCTPPHSSAGEAGFSTAYFDAATLNNVMAHAECVKVRIYDARRNASDTKGTAMVVGVRSDGTEIYNDVTGPKYRLSDALSGTIVVVRLLTRTAARTACTYVKDAGEKSYCADFTKAEVQAVLATATCNGIKVVPVGMGGGVYTLKISAVKIASSVATDIAPPVFKQCSEPCPSFCGPAGNYVNR